MNLESQSSRDLESRVYNLGVGGERFLIKFPLFLVGGKSRQVGFKRMQGMGWNWDELSVGLSLFWNFCSGKIQDERDVLN